MIAYLSEWLNLLLRWFHVTAAIAWIGESFYFVMLDRSLLAPPAGTPSAGVAGEFWAVHGGGFYHSRKFLVAPPDMPSSLHWSKWKSYATWLSGAALLTLLYFSSPGLYLVDPAVAPMAPWLADLVAVVFLAGGWVVYDLLCKALGARETVLGAAMLAFTAGAAFIATHVFSGRAAFLLTGAMLATIMTANVLFVIIPGQRRMVDALLRGLQPDPDAGLHGRQRSVHNTYFTLPVVFAMLSNHFAFLFGARHAWLVLTAVMLSGALTRQFFVLWHAGRRAYAYPAAAALLVVSMIAWLAPSAAPTASARFAQAKQVVTLRCAPCHAARPSLMDSAPQGILLDTDARIVKAAPLILQQAVQSHAMPLGNATEITEDERNILQRWIAAGAHETP